MSDPFTVLGLPVRPDLTDKQVRAAWRAIAAATHPDRPGGGNAERYAAASAAYAALRTPWARSEAYADLIAQPPHVARPAARTGPRPPGAKLARSVLLLPARVRHGRPLRLLARILAAAVLALVVMRSGAGGPPIAGVLAGLVLWLAFTARADLAPPPGR
jgi:hypothetical protein